MADTIREMKKQGDDVELYAIGSRTQAKADRFAINTGCKKAYGSYEDLLKDPFIDLVYIATPHSEHYQNMLLCLKYEKPVLSYNMWRSTFAKISGHWMPASAV